MKNKKGLIKKTIIGITALCIATAFATGVYAAKKRGLKDAVIETSNTGNDTEQAVMISSFEGSNEYKAAVEWKEFEDSYDPGGSILSQVDQEGPEDLGLDEKYNAYNVYTQEMADKVDEITEKYGLSLHTNFTEMSYEEMVQTVINDNTEFTDTTINSPLGGYRYEDGSFRYDGNFIDSSRILSFDYQLSRISKGTFDTGFLNIGNIDDYQEQEITTDSDVSVIAALSEHKALLLKEYDSCVVRVNVLGGIADGISFDTLKELANAFNFTVIETKEFETPQEEDPNAIIGPESITVVREGIADQIPVELVRVINFDTIIAMAPEYFTYSNEHGGDTFTYDAWKGERPVYYRVNKFEDKTPEEMSEWLIEKNADKYEGYSTSEFDLRYHNVKNIHFDSANEAPDYQLEFYIIESGDDCIIIETQYSREMYEGLYKIIYGCIDLFSMKGYDN